MNGSHRDCGADVDWNFLPSWSGMWCFACVYTLWFRYLYPLWCHSYI